MRRWNGFLCFIELVEAQLFTCLYIGLSLIQARIVFVCQITVDSPLMMWSLSFNLSFLLAILSCMNLIINFMQNTLHVLGFELLIDHLSLHSIQVIKLLKNLLFMDFLCLFRINVDISLCAGSQLVWRKPCLFYVLDFDKLLRFALWVLGLVNLINLLVSLLFLFFSNID